VAIKVYSDGAPFHGKNLANILGATFITDIHTVSSNDTLIIVGIYSPLMKDFEVGVRRAKKVICHWIGTDIWQAMNGDHFSKCLRSSKVVHLTEDVRLQHELKTALGLESIILSDVPQALFEYTPLPKKFAIGVYMYNTRLDFYRNNLMIDVANKFPEIDFYFFGEEVEKGIKIENMEWLGFVPMNKLIPKINGILRFPIHDGLPFGPIEMMTAGRWTIQEIVMPFMYSCTPEIGIICKMIEEIIEKTDKGYFDSKRWKECGTWYRKRYAIERYKDDMEKYLQ